MDGCRRSVSRGDADACRTAAACRCSCSTNSPADSPFLVDESGRILADVQRPRDGRRKTPVRTAGRRLARIRFRGPTGCRPPAGATAAGAQVSTVAAAGPAVDVRARSQRSHQRARPAAKRSPAHVPRDGHRRRAADRLRGRGQSAVFQRQAVGGDGAGCAAARQTSAFCSSRAARAGCRRNRCSTCACRGRSPFGGVGRIELLLDVLNALNDTAEEGLATRQSVQPEFRSATTSSWIRVARCSA